MGPISAARLLDVWERGRSRPAAERAVSLLSAASPGDDPDAIARLSLGRRDARLLDLREAVFGPDVTGLVECPGCAGLVELAFRTGDIRAAEPDPTDPLRVTAAGYEVEFRLPESRDQLAAGRAAGVEQARRMLLERCVSAARFHGERVRVGDLPADAVAAVASGMAAADPQADVRLAVGCPACGHGWEAGFDVVAYFWAELDSWARRTLGEVHSLATAYGWTEAEVLALSPERRRAYLELVGG